MLNLFGHYVNEYYVRRFRRNFAERAERLQAIRTPADFSAYQQGIRAKLQQAFNLPAEKCDLQPRVTGTHRGDGFRVDNVIYHSRPQFPVTANLYVPDGVSQAPAILFVCGHSTNGKAAEVYQRACINLARNGYVVLCPDPSGQGERSLFIDAPDAAITGTLFSTTSEHNMIAKQMLLTGEFYASWCLWDAVRSLDYLLSRPEIDPQRVGVTGNSGGGNMTAFLTAVDERLAAAAPSCYMGSWKQHIDNEEICDAEQEPQFLVGMGGEMGDLLLAHAPRPTLILGQLNDFFDERAARATHAEISRIYALLGAEEKAAVFIGPRDHGYGPENRAAMYAFFNHHFGLPAPSPEPADMPVFTDAELTCTPTGQVHHLPGTRNIIDFIRAKAEVQKAARPALSRPELAARLAADCRLGDVEIPYYRMLRPYLVGDGQIQFCSRFGLETEPEMLAILKFMSKDARHSYHFPENLDAVTLYIPHLDSVDEILRIDAYRENDGWFGLDYRGVGEMTALAGRQDWGGPYRRRVSADPLYSATDQTGRDLFAPYNIDYHFAACGLMLDEPYLGARVRDIIAALRLITSRGNRNVHLLARGQGAVPAVFAALISGLASRVTLMQAPDSFAAMLDRQIIAYPQSMMPLGILAYTDLPEIYRLLDVDFANYWG